VDEELRSLVWQRAKSRCEYCHLPDGHTDAPFQVDHIVAQKHGGRTESDNLALACFYCNSYKGANIAGLDPVTGRLVRLFHPRIDRWSKHFAWNDETIQGRTAIGRATAQVLWMNHPLAIEMRRLLRVLGVAWNDA
jgi:hypothetical protein